MKKIFDQKKVGEICNRCISNNEPFVLVFPIEINIDDVIEADDTEALTHSTWGASFTNGDDYIMTGLEVFTVLKTMHKMNVRLDENAKIMEEKKIEKKSVKIEVYTHPNEFNCKAFNTCLSLCRITIFPPGLDHWPYVLFEEEKEKKEKRKVDDKPPEGDQSWRDEVE